MIFGRHQTTNKEWRKIWRLVVGAMKQSRGRVINARRMRHQRAEEAMQNTKGRDVQDQPRRNGKSKMEDTMKNKNKKGWRKRQQSVEDNRQVQRNH